MQQGMLEPLGISGVQGRLYGRVVAEPGSTAAELAAAVGVAAGRVRGMLAGLVEAGLVTRLAGRPARFLPAPPDVAVDALVRARQQELERVREYAQALARQLRDAPRGRVADMIELVDGEQTVVRLVTQLQLGARREVMIVDCPPYLYRPSPGNLQETQSMRRGVRYRAIYHAPVLDEPGRMRDLMASTAAGEQARVLPDVHMKMIISDASQALIPVAFDAAELTSLILVHASPLLQALVMSFEHLWQRAVPVGGADNGGEHHDVPGSSDRDMLTMLAAGMKDRAIARALGITERSVTRRVTHLLTTLGASTRFQAGLQAAKRGWI